MNDKIKKAVLKEGKVSGFLLVFHSGKQERVWFDGITTPDEIKIDGTIRNAMIDGDSIATGDGFQLRLSGDIKSKNDFDIAIQKTNDWWIEKIDEIKNEHKILHFDEHQRICYKLEQLKKECSSKNP